MELVLRPDFGDRWPRINLALGRKKNQNQRLIPRRPRKMGVLVSSPEIQAFSGGYQNCGLGIPPLRKLSWEKLGNFLESVGWSERQLCISADSKRGQPKGATPKNAKRCQNILRHFLTFLIRAGQNSSKGVNYSPFAHCYLPITYSSQF